MDVSLINLESTLCPKEDKASVNWDTLTDPKSLTLSSATFTFIVTSEFLISSASLFAASTSASSFLVCWRKFSANIFLADSVASIANPLGIKKFLAYPSFTETISFLKPSFSTSLFKIIRKRVSFFEIRS
mgnify:CR=1 FL=1